MCGLTGFAAHPDHGGTAYAKLLLADLLLSIENRGRQATGIAALGGKDSFIYKIALAPSTVVRSPSFAAAVDRIQKQFIVLGHTRNAYVDGGQNNSGRDECAHPFCKGKVVGAHNGVIYNWRTIMADLKPVKPYLVDSEAVFDLLNSEKEPEKALEELEGYFALTWVKNRRLFLARSNAAPLSAAYVPSIRTLFWHSELPKLEAVFAQAGLQKGEYETWGLKQEVIYSYDPRKFTEEGTGVSRQEVTFKQATGRQHDSRRSYIPAGVGLSTGKSSGGGSRNWGPDNYNGSRSRYLDDDDGYSGYDPTNIRQRWQSSASAGLSGAEGPLPESRRLGSGQITLTEVLSEVAALRDRIKVLERTQDVLIEMLKDAGVFDEEDERIQAAALGSTEEGDEPPLDESQAEIFG